MNLIIAEKASVASKIAEALNINKRTSEGYYLGENVIVAFASGHLLTLKMPAEIDERYKKWSLDELPFHFTDIDLVVSKNSAKHIKMLKSILKNHKITSVTNACDSDREGELIYRNISNHLKLYRFKEHRLWLVTSNSKEAILEGLKEKLDLSEFDALYESSKARSYADYLIGLNSTMSFTAKAGRLFTLGRVQTPTLNMIYENDKEITNFTSKPFWQIKGRFAFKDVIYDGTYIDPDLEKNRFLDEKTALSVLNKCQKMSYSISDIKERTTYENPKPLYDLSSLQIEANQQHQISASKTLEIAQSLYEKHELITYPRTDQTVISEKFAKFSNKIAHNLPIFDEYIKEIKSNKYTLNKRCINLKNEVFSHEAITPVAEPITADKYAKLNDLEKKIFNMIAKRFLENFFPAKKILKTKVTTSSSDNEHHFETEQNTVIDKGYDLHYEEKNPHIEFEKGDVKTVKIDTVEGKTKPAPRFKEGSLIAAMKNPVKYLKDSTNKSIIKEIQGIGTEATRATIIENLKQQEYITLEKGYIYITDKGKFLIENLPNETLKEIDLTANIEGSLQEILSQNKTFDDVLEEVKSMNKKTTQQIKNSNLKREMKTEDGITKIPCPNCGDPMKKNSYGYFCTSDCGVKLFRTSLERPLGYKKLTDKQIEELLIKNKTSKKASFVSKRTGKRYEAFICYEFNIEEKYPNKFSISFD